MNDDNIATVKDLIEYLENNFKRDDMLCFFDEGGAWCEVEHVPNSFIGDIKWMFNYVKDKKRHELENIRYRNEDEEKHLGDIIEENYRNVNENGVLIF